MHGHSLVKKETALYSTSDAQHDVNVKSLRAETRRCHAGHGEDDYQAACRASFPTISTWRAGIDEGRGPVRPVGMRRRRQSTRTWSSLLASLTSVCAARYDAM